MHNLDVEEAIQKNRKTTLDIRKALDESITNGISNVNTEIQEKVSYVIRSEDAAKIVQEFKQIIKSKNSDIIWLTCHQGQLFQKCKEK